MTCTIDTSHRSRVEVGVQDVVVHVHLLAKTALVTGSRLINNGNVLERWKVHTDYDSSEEEDDMEYW